MTLDDIFFGDGSDGNVTLNSSATLTRDMYYDTATAVAGCDINTAGFRVFCKTKLDLTNAPAGAFHNNGVNGSNATGATGGANNAANTTHWGLPNSTTGQAGVNGTTAAGGQAANPGTGLISAGGVEAGDNGKGGAGTSAGGAQRTALVQAYQDGFPKFGSLFGLVGVGQTFVTGATQILFSGISGIQGSAGGGGGGQSGGGGGGAPTPGSSVAIYAKEIDVTGAVPGVIQAKGANGGNGGNGAGANTGGGGGASGSTGGYVLLTYATLTGTATGVVDVSGGNGGNGGNGGVSANGGDGGGSAAGGALTHIDTTAGTVTNTLASQTRNAGSAASGATGGAGATAAVAQISL